MSSKQKIITQGLFWGAFGIFLAVSIPHIAWVVFQYTPQDASVWVSVGYGALSLGYAIAIDGIMAWLTHAQSSQKRAFSRDAIFTWIFIFALVAMSWYLNWVYNVAHDPSHQGGEVWKFALTSQWGVLPEITVGTFTPWLLAALPVFTIAYVGVLNNVNNMKEEAAKSVEDLENEAKVAVRRATAMKQIKDARSSDDTVAKVVDNAFGIAGKFKENLREFRGTKRDPEMEKQTKVLQMFRDVPSLLEPQNEENGVATIKEMLRIKRDAEARFWWLKAKTLLEQKQAEEQEENVAHSVDDSLEETSTGETHKKTTQQDEESTSHTENNASKTSTATPASTRATTPLSITIQEAAAQLELSEAYIRELRNNGKLRSPARSKKMILISSLKTYQESRAKKEPVTDKTASIKSEQNHQQNGQSGGKNGNGSGYDKETESVMNLPMYTA